MSQLTLFEQERPPRAPDPDDWDRYADWRDTDTDDESEEDECDSITGA